VVRNIRALEAPLIIRQAQIIELRISSANLTTRIKDARIEQTRMGAKHSTQCSLQTAQTPHSRPIHALRWRMGPLYQNAMQHQQLELPKILVGLPNVHNMTSPGA